MDPSRRFAAGELAELFGVNALAARSPHKRIHRFRHVAQQVIERES